MIFMSYDTFFNKKLNVYYGYYIEVGNLLIPIVIMFFLAGMFFLYQTYKEFKNPTIPTPQNTICPNCKQTYNSQDLKDGKCPTCKDIDTVEIEKYYKDNPSKGANK